VQAASVSTVMGPVSLLARASLDQRYEGTLIMLSSDDALPSAAAEAP